MKKFLGSFRNNISLKLLSLLIAVVIWYVVVDMNDPVESASYPVKVTVENEGYINNGKTKYYIDDANKTVTVFLRANRSTLRHVTADDITVTADLTQIVDMNLDPVMVPLTATCSGVPPTGITLARTTIPITIESIASATFPVQVDTGDSDPSQEYEVGSMTSNPDQVVISGPKSIINQIDAVIARIDVTGLTRSSTRPATLVLLDKNSEEISEDTIQDDLTFEGGIPNISVNVELWKKKSDVRLEVSYNGAPAEGYHVESVAVTPDTVTVVGNPAALNDLQMDGNKLKIDSEQLTVEGLQEDVTAEIDLTEILPENMRIAESSPNTAIVTITILLDDTTEIALDVDDIEERNLASNLAVSYGQTSLTVRVKGSSNTISTLTGKDLGAYIDLDGLTAGEQTLPVYFELPAGAALDFDEELSIAVSLKEKAKTDTDTETGADTSETGDGDATAAPSAEEASEAG